MFTLPRRTAWVQLVSVLLLFFISHLTFYFFCHSYLHFLFSSPPSITPLKSLTSQYLCNWVKEKMIKKNLVKTSRRACNQQSVRLKSGWELGIRNRGGHFWSLFARHRNYVTLISLALRTRNGRKGEFIIYWVWSHKL